MSKPYYYRCLVPFHLADPAGMLFFGHAFTLFHQAFEHFILHQLAYPWHLWFQNPDWIVPIKHAEAQYLAPIQAGQDCQIELIVSSVSTSSFTIASSIQQNQSCCSIKTVHVFCNRLTKKKMPIPQDLMSHFHGQQEVLTRNIRGEKWNICNFKF
jgi:acyl-CoA thioester hydrolase/1,4-dihydroxy-2-naphthoyl-CoA hydrolase